MKTLHSKLLAPRVEGTLMRSSREELRGEIPRKRVTTVVAGAGYGKTTFAAQAVAGMETVWYRLDEGDRDLRVFLRYIVEGVRKFYPGFGDIPTAGPEAEKLLGKDNQGIVVALLHELEAVVERELMIVLDDYHAAGDSGDIRDAMQFMVEHLPPRVHLVIVSRMPVDLSLSRLWIMGEVAVVEEPDLVFSPEEVVQLAEDLFGMSFPREIMERVHAWTQGWVAGVILFSHGVRGKGREHAGELFDRLNGSARALFDYFDENVFALLPERIRAFLLRTSLMSPLNSTLCDRFLGMGSSRDILAYLDENHLFTYSLDEVGEEYAYHHLFQEYLRTKAADELGEEEAEKLHRKLGGILEEQGMTEEAISHYIQARAFDDAALLLTHYGVGMIWEGRWTFVRGAMGRIPRSVVLAYPWLVYIQAEIDVRLGLPRDALKGFQRAVEMFEASGSQVGVDLSRFNLGIIYFQTGYFKKSMEQHLNTVNTPSVSPRIKIMLQSHLIFMHALLGRFDEADAFYRDGMAQAALLRNPRERDESELYLMVNHITRLNESGDWRQSILLGEEILARADKYGWFRVQVFTYSNMSLAAAQAGQNTRGLGYADTGLALMKDKGLQDHIKGWLLLGRCINLAGLRRIPEAIDSAKQAREFFRDQGSLWGEAWVCTFLQSFYLTTGDLASCEETALYGLELAKTLDSSQCRVSLNVGLSFLRSLQGRADEADAHIREAARECSASSMYQAWVAAARVVAANARGDGDQAVEHMRACLSLCRANGLDTLLMTIFPMILVPLADLYASGDMGDYLEALFTGMDPGLKAIVEWLAANGDENVARACTVILGVLPRPAPPGLRVCCLGRFRLFQGEREILSKSWPSRKARMLFKLLVHYRSRGYVSKEVFMEHLWPEDDPQKTAKRFHVALATVRKVVAGGNGRETASYVKSDGDTYLLDLGDGGSVDVDEFEAACDAAREARDAALAAGHLLRALSLFQGDFLEEDLYEPWCGAERDRLKDKHLSVLASIADYYRAEKDFPKAVEFCGRYLDKDPYAEDVYQQLMLIHGVTGNRAMVKKIYDRCRRNIVEGLGCALSPETEEIADELLS